MAQALPAADLHLALDVLLQARTRRSPSTLRLASTKPRMRLTSSSVRLWTRGVADRCQLVADAGRRGAPDPPEDVGEPDLSRFSRVRRCRRRRCEPSALPLLVSGLVQMTMTRPWRRITLRLSHIFLTLGSNLHLVFSSRHLAVDPTPAEVVRGQKLHLSAICRGGSGCSASASSPRCGRGPCGRSRAPHGTWRLGAAR